jgi:ribosome assembly protein 1
VVIEDAETREAKTTVERDPYGPLSGQVISAMRRGCRAAFLARKGSSRLVEAVFHCDMQCTADQLGKLYSVLGQRRCEILDEDVWEGTSIFSIKARIPVAETVGLAGHLRKQTSGGISSPQLRFDRWQVLDLDPFFQPTTVAEREEHGEVRHENQTRNIAKEFIDMTRARKGLDLNKKIVVNAEKQRTLSKKK